jgi:uncharacterized repeat protein (TIGR01451 family)
VPPTATPTDTPVPPTATHTSPPVTSTPTAAAQNPSPTPTLEEIPPTPLQAPDLSIAKSHAGNFQPGGNGTFILRVTNVGAAATSLPITVTDQLPVPLTLNGTPIGNGWSCGASMGTMVSCTTNAILQPGNSLPDIMVPVHVGQTELRQVDNMARVTTQNDTNPDNDTDTDRILLVRVTRAAPTLSPLGGAFAIVVLLALGLFGLRRGHDRS